MHKPQNCHEYRNCVYEYFYEKLVNCKFINQKIKQEIAYEHFRIFKLYTKRFTAILKNNGNVLLRVQSHSNFHVTFVTCQICVSFSKIPKKFLDCHSKLDEKNEKD